MKNPNQPYGGFLKAISYVNVWSVSVTVNPLVVENQTTIFKYKNIEF